MVGKPVKKSVECWIIRRMVDAEDAVLLLHVAASPDIPTGFWQPVTGGIKEGETSREACVREVYEETSLRIRVEAQFYDAIFWKIASNPRRYGIANLLGFWPPLQVRANASPEEHDDWKWVPVSAVEAELYWESNRRTWAAVRDYLRP
ncbi:MAG: NUDIX domain-containing protein [Clostridiales bacterium]|nr:NUDIX domain-containing protein [Clostridiales bacterium]